MTVQSRHPSPPVIRFAGVTLGYDTRVILRDLDLEVYKGEVVALIGGSGSGKTTLLRAATGQIRAAKGMVTVFDQDINRITPQQLGALRRRMGVLFQQGALFTDLSVFDNVAFPLRELSKDSEPVILEKVLDKLDQVGLKRAAHLGVSEISGGMARRVALARAIVLEPEVILFDEPFAGLDPITLGMTARLIRRLTDKLGCATVLITHDLEESFLIADQVYMVGEGSMVVSGTPDEVRKSDKPLARQFLKGTSEGPVVFEYPPSADFDRWLARQSGGDR